MNKVILSGNLTRDPEVKYSNGEKATCACRFNIAVRRKFKNSEGKYDADFINCVAFGPTGEFIGKFFKTGNGIEIVGSIRTGSYTNKDGVKVYTTDVYVDEETLEYSTKSGIETNILHTSHITLRDQISSALTSGQDGATILDIRPAGTSLLPDVQISNINNDTIQIIDTPSADSDKTIDCKSIISELDGVYNKNSLSQYLICQFLYWQQLEKRINIKECLMAGRSDCM